jgi:hypothetical protein
VGAGLHPDLAAAARAMVHEQPPFEPRAAEAALHARLYREVYRPLYPRLAPLFAKLAPLGAGPAGGTPPV